MDLDLTKEQKILKISARDFLKKECPRSLIREMKDDAKGYPQKLWDQMAELGWLGLAIPEKYGGTFLDVCVLLETMGEACCPAPFFSTIITGALPIMFAGTEQQKETLLPEIADGSLLPAFAMTEPAKKMQSIGTLAGGIAHDFNNILTTILGNIFLARMQVTPEDERKLHL